MSLLIFSPKCNHSLDIIDYVNNNPQLKRLVQYHNVNTMGIPPQYRNKITRVPTMLTKNGKILVGNEIKNWLESLLPNKELESCDFGNCVMTTLDGESNQTMFGLDDYGRSLQPPMTKELQDKINQSVSDAYTDIKK
tara:strand:+ start:4618 stop:5028 length:411 start_codon:yes stop_codon:yes gene_type:complete